uniref:Putative disrupter of silencing sas10 n=1 Tax=Amblyomma aureolatum TaxID=187763 RepID=A0A1E1XB62_9ACAR
MGKKKSGRGRAQNNEASTALGSDDEALYSDLEQPDEKSNEYLQDAVDAFHVDRDKVLLDDSDTENTSGQEEVLSLGDDDDDSENDSDLDDSEDELGPISEAHSRNLRKDEMASDIEDEEDGLPDAKAWGKKKSTYYHTDFIDEDYAGISEDAAELARLEEQEARALQRRLVEQLDEDDFGLDLFQLPKEESAEVSEKVSKDLSKLSKREKLKLLSKDSAELLELIDDFKAKMIELRDTILPLAKLVDSGKITSVPANEYVNLKRQLILQYCTNIAFYMILKAKRVPVGNHPVIKRLISFRNLLKQLEPVDKRLSYEVNVLLDKLSKGEDIVPLTVPTTKPQEKPKLRITQQIKSEAPGSTKETPVESQTKQRKDLKRKHTQEEQTILDMYAEMRKKSRFEGSSASEGDSEEDETELDAFDGDEEERLEEEPEEAAGDDRRGITYQIAKNKGLTAKRKKEYRNPRVRHKMKYRKAKISRKGQVREVRTELQKYGGELSGIRAGVTRSIKMK